MFKDDFVAFFITSHTVANLQTATVRSSTKINLADVWKGGPAAKRI